MVLIDYSYGNHRWDRELMPPRPFASSSDIARALQLVGELLEAAEETYAVVVVGGAALNLLGIVARATTDVDVLAFARPAGPGSWRLSRAPAQLPDPLARAIRTVAQDLNLTENWLNTGPASQWDQGLPRGLGRRIRWRRFAALNVGVAARTDLIRLKLFAAVDADGPERGRHSQDLTALAPTDAELRAAGRWVKTQDAGEAFPALVDQ